MRMSRQAKRISLAILISSDVKNFILFILTRGSKNSLRWKILSQELPVLLWWGWLVAFSIKLDLQLLSFSPQPFAHYMIVLSVVLFFPPPAPLIGCIDWSVLLILLALRVPALLLPAEFYFCGRWPLLCSQNFSRLRIPVFPHLLKLLWSVISPSKV